MTTKQELQQAIDKVWYALGPEINCPCGPTNKEKLSCLQGLVIEAQTALDAISPYVSEEALKAYRNQSGSHVE